MLWWIVLVGCQRDLVLAMGDLTGVADAAEKGRNAPTVEEPVFELPSKQPDIVATPMEGTTGVGGAARDAAAPTGRGFNPISVPQGPSEGTGVSFEGVSSRSSPSAMRGPGAINEFRNKKR